MIQHFLNNNWEGLPLLWKEYEKRKKGLESEIFETLRELRRSEQEKLWTLIFRYFSHLLNSFDEDGNTKENLNSISAVFLLASVHCDTLIASAEHNGPADLLRLIELTGNLMSKFEGGLKKLAVSICEKWILNGFEGKEMLYAKTLLTSIEISQLTNAKKQDVRRVWLLREGLKYLDLDGSVEAKESVTELLLLCIETPNYISCNEGIRFLSLIFAIPSLMKDFHKRVKNQLPYTTKSKSSKFSEVYFGTWKQLGEELKERLEEDCLQDLMYLAIHVNQFFSKLSTNLNAFLHYIHKYKKHAPTATVIYRLYEPFIWRSLKVANGYVRQHATIILCDAFPFMEMNASQEQKESLMDQQYSALLDLLMDPCHLVRIEAIKGVFLILSNYWLMIPNHVIQKMFQIFVTKLIVDASTAEVRVEVVKGFTSLLDCPDAGPFISEVLIRISDSFDDINASVRVAFIKLLLKVKSTNFTKYWKLVPIEHLIIRMADDVDSVRVLIAQLVQASFLPFHLDTQELLLRCVSLVEMNRMASRRFYQYMSKKMDLETTIKFVLLIWGALHKYIIASQMQSDSSITSLSDGSSCGGSSAASGSSMKKRRKRRTAGRGRNKENSSPDLGSNTDYVMKAADSKRCDDNMKHSPLLLDDPNVIEGLLDTVVILWTANSASLARPENFKYLDALRARISQTFPSIWSFFKDASEIRKTLLYLSSFLPASIMPTMVGLCLSHLRALSQCAGGALPAPETYTTYLNALCNWNRVDDILELLSEWLAVTFASFAKFGDHKIKSKVCFQEKNSPYPLLALKFLRHLLEHPLNRICLLQKHRALLVEMCHKMADVKELIAVRADQDTEISTLCSDEFLLTAWKDYLVIVTLLNQGSDSAEEDQAASQGGRILELPSREFKSVEFHCENIDFIIRAYKDSKSSAFGTESFMHQCLIRMAMGGHDLMAIHAANLAFVERYLKFIEDSLAIFFTGKVNIWMCNFIVQICLGIGESHEFLLLFSKDRFHLLPISSSTERVMRALITFISKYGSILSTLTEADCNLVVENMNKCIDRLAINSDLLLQSLSLHLLRETLAVIAKDLEANPGIIPDLDKISDFPTSGRLLVLSSCKSTSSANALKYFFNSQHLPVISDVLAATLLLSTLTNESKLSVSMLKEIVVVAKDLLDRIDEPSTVSEDTVTDELESSSEVLVEGKVEFFRFCYMKSKEIVHQLCETNGLH